MNTNKSYFHIKLENLPKNSIIFPFHLYIFNPFNKQYNIFLYANSPFEDSKKSDLKSALQKGAILAVSIKQKRTFLLDSNLKEDEIDDLREAPVHELVQLREKKLSEIQANDKNIPESEQFNLRKEIRLAIENDNFKKLIQKIHEEVSVFHVTLSPTVSLAQEFCNKILFEDDSTNRKVALSYILAMIMGMNSEEELASIICAAFLHHIGLTQLSPFYSITPYSKFNDKERDKFKRHPGLSQHLIRKSGLELGQRSLRIILEHHERADGSGFPYSLMGDRIDPLSLVLGASSYLIDYAEGKISGKKTPLNSVFVHLKNKTLPSGLEFEFGHIIYSNLISFIDTKNNIPQEKL